eukprot:181418-Pyramimonas_sp.AAC.1
MACPLTFQQTLARPSSHFRAGFDAGPSSFTTTASSEAAGSHIRIVATRSSYKRTTSAMSAAKTKAKKKKQLDAVATGITVERITIIAMRNTGDVACIFITILRFSAMSCASVVSSDSDHDRLVRDHSRRHGAQCPGGRILKMPAFFA